jgi:hypothetical protein
MMCLPLLIVLSQELSISDVHPLPLSTSEPTSDPVLQEPRQSNWVSQPPDRYGFSHSALQANINTIYVPKSYSEASTQECWQQAMQDELQALQDNHTWNIIPCPYGENLLDANGYTPLRWVLMDLLTDIKLYWWHSETDNNMA